MARLGFEVLVPPGARSNILTTFKLRAGVTYPTLHDAMKRRGYIIYAGQGAIATHAFRVANMGTLAPADMDKVVAAFAASLDEISDAQPGLDGASSERSALANGQGLRLVDGRATPAVDELAPAAVVGAAGLGGPRKDGVGAHRPVVGAARRRGVRQAPARVEDLAARVGVGLAAGAVRAGNRGRLGDVLRHGLMAMTSLAMLYSSRQVARNGKFACGRRARPLSVCVPA